jgi:hypothetical protein
MELDPMKYTFCHNLKGRSRLNDSKGPPVLGLTDQALQVSGGKKIEYQFEQVQGIIARGDNEKRRKKSVSSETVKPESEHLLPLLEYLLGEKLARSLCSLDDHECFQLGIWL